MSPNRLALLATLFLAIVNSANAGPAPVTVPETGNTFALFAVAVAIFAVARFIAHRNQSQPHREL